MNKEDLQKIMVIEHTGPRTWRFRARTATLGLIAWLTWLYIVWYFFSFNHVILTQELIHGWYFKDINRSIFLLSVGLLFGLHTWARYKKIHTTTLFVYPLTIASILLLAGFVYVQYGIIHLNEILVQRMIELTIALAATASIGYWLGQIRGKRSINAKTALLHGVVLGHAAIFLASYFPLISVYVWFILFFSCSYLISRKYGIPPNQS
ncbi:hypothetical protein GCM10009007_04030 [Formosimonas limnophila]|uniref:Uncharacterized protein n=1 Tax=Formosimonas limnophila TaxID=1384487 RepID=A0A8J3FZ98_9BURK|nr:hypothetical protein [Formosimonas limnophila]GHA66718.1 hypothetical protein GCM10009007_04030 [Formosimonas limnophila]